MTTTLSHRDLPGQNCGVCGYRTCDALAVALENRPDLIERCIHLSESRFDVTPAAPSPVPAAIPREPTVQPAAAAVADEAWRDSLGRDFDFYLEHFPEEPGPREIILPHNPILTREMDVQVDDLLIGRPLGMSCGCPITHCGVVTEVDRRTGVIVWCVTGPLAAREKGFKDIGYYIAEGYEGLITQTRADIRIGMRYFFQPRRCMLQWRHSGLVNYLNRTDEGLQVRVEGLWIG
ncbi:MAG: (Fe-S)-binding protein [Azospirillaceae bacterium]|nr:(Fe-S)-binding protein [Azospirillaceae bacterium]